MASTRRRISPRWKMTEWLIDLPPAESFCRPPVEIGKIRPIGHDWFRKLRVPREAPSPALTNVQGL